MIYLPPHKASLHLTHNNHTVNYETVEEYILREEERFDFRSGEEREACITNGEIWELQWYPNTPIGFCCIAAPTLEALIEYAEELHDEMDVKI